MSHIGFLLARHRKHPLEDLDLIAGDRSIRFRKLRRKRDHADGEGDLVLLADAPVAACAAFLALVLVAPLKLAPGRAVDKDVAGEQPQQRSDRTPDRKPSRRAKNFAPNR